MFKVILKKNNIVNMDVDCIVNAANKELLAGGGVCGAIFASAGYQALQAECNSLSPIKTGEVAITKGYNLKAKYIIHAVGPIYRGIESNQLLYNAYYNSLLCAENNHIKSIAFPSISTGIYGFPVEKASIIAMEAIKDYQIKNINSCIEEVYFCFIDDITYNYYKKAYEEVLL